MFVIKTQEKQADPRYDMERRILVYRDDILHVIMPWREYRDDAWNHRNAARASLNKSAPGGLSMHHIIGAAPVPGVDWWVVLVEEGE
jgi:hypothetical protein